MYITDMGWSSHIHVEQGAGEVEPEVCIDKKAGTAGLRIATVSHRVLHVRYRRAETGIGST